MKFFGILLSLGSFMVLDVAAQYDRSGDENTWNYGGEEYWPTSHSKAELGSYYDCDGIKQSPININNSMVQDLYFYNQLSLADYDAEYAGVFTNNGHTLVFNLDDAESGGTLPTFSSPFVATNAKYELQQFHFHWGSRPDIGSEHTIDGIAFPMEIHLVHKKTDYASVGDSLDYNDGLAVIGIFFQVADTSDEGLEDIIDAAETIAAAADQSAEEVAGSINMSTFLYQTGRSYYYYKGSLTTPPCTETVDWHVMEGAIRITEEDLEILRDLTYNDGAPMVDNYRNTMPLNNRIIKRVFN
jgi:carbonic anhydrase